MGMVRKRWRETPPGPTPDVLAGTRDGLAGTRDVLAGDYEFWRYLRRSK
jgi:hypothetical protein